MPNKLSRDTAIYDAIDEALNRYNQQRQSNQGIKQTAESLPSTKVVYSMLYFLLSCNSKF
jgi:hypothetical protein